ncbi:hypothetical protein AAC387_Pa05g3448 [Persea americana]
MAECSDGLLRQRRQTSSRRQASPTATEDQTSVRCLDLLCVSASVFSPTRRRNESDSSVLSEFQITDGPP